MNLQEQERMPDEVSRKEKDPPTALANWGWRYHHMGIPTDEKRPGERYLD